MTFMIYLSSIEAGGHTVFPQPGISGKDLFDRGHSTHSTLYPDQVSKEIMKMELHFHNFLWIPNPDVLKIKTIVVVNQNV